MRHWIFVLIFSTLLGNMNAHQVQLVTHHEKENGVLIRIVVSNVPEVDDIAGWVGQENWFYLTLNKSVFAENVLDELWLGYHDFVCFCFDCQICFRQGYI